LFALFPTVSLCVLCVNFIGCSETFGCLTADTG